MRCALVKVYTNQGIVGYGEVRDGASKTYRAGAEEPASRREPLRRRPALPAGEAVRRARPSGRRRTAVGGRALGPRRQGLRRSRSTRCSAASSATGSAATPTPTRAKPSGEATGKRLKERMALGFTFLKMDLGLAQISHIEGHPLRAARLPRRLRCPRPSACRATTPEERAGVTRSYESHNVMHPFTGLHFTEKGLASSRNTAPRSAP